MSDSNLTVIFLFFIFLSTCNQCNEIRDLHQDMNNKLYQIQQLEEKLRVDNTYSEYSACEAGLITPRGDTIPYAK